MAILRDMLAQRPSDVSRLDNLESFVKDAFGGQPVASGVRVTEESSMQVSAVNACVNLLAGSVASLPVHVYRRTAAGKERATDHPLYRLVHDEPNDEMTSTQWREAKMAGVLLWGNGYSAIDIDRVAGEVRGLYPITPARVTPRRDDQSRQIVFDIAITGGQPLTLPAWEMLHVPALGFDGLVGKSPIGLMREAVGLAAVTERHGASFFGRGARPGIALKHPKMLSPKAVENIKKMWRQDHEGIEKAHGVSVLGEGMDVSSFSIPNEQAQFLETRKFQVSDIARAFLVPGWMIGDHESGTAWPTAIENIGIFFVVHVLRRWLVKFEQAMNSKLFTRDERKQGYFVEFDVDGLLRGDTLTRFQAFSSALTNGWMSRNEVRQLQNLNKVEGLDEFMTPGGGNAMKPATGNPRDAAQAFAPLFRETWARIFRRDRNDRPVAEKKGQIDAWLEQHLAYAREQLGTVVAAYKTAGGRCLSAAELVAAEYGAVPAAELDPATRAEAATNRALQDL